MILAAVGGIAVVLLILIYHMYFTLLREIQHLRDLIRTQSSDKSFAACLSSDGVITYAASSTPEGTRKTLLPKDVTIQNTFEMLGSVFDIESSDLWRIIDNEWENHEGPTDGFSPFRYKMMGCLQRYLQHQNLGIPTKPVVTELTDLLLQTLPEDEIPGPLQKFLPGNRKKGRRGDTPR